MTMDAEQLLEEFSRLMKLNVYEFYAEFGNFYKVASVRSKDTPEIKEAALFFGCIDSPELIEEATALFKKHMNKVRKRKSDDRIDIEYPVEET